MLPSRSSKTDMSMSSLMLSGLSGEWRYRTALRRLRSILTSPLPACGQPQVAVGVFVNSLRPAEAVTPAVAIGEGIQREPPRMRDPRRPARCRIREQVDDPQHARVVLERLHRERLGHVQADPLRYFFRAPVEGIQTRSPCTPTACLPGPRRSISRPSCSDCPNQPDRESSGGRCRSRDPADAGRPRWPTTISRPDPG